MIREDVIIVQCSNMNVDFLLKCVSFMLNNVAGSKHLQLLKSQSVGTLS